MPKYRVHEFVQVRVTSSEIEAADPILAYEQFRQKVNMDQLLRNVTGTAWVAQVEFAEERQSATIDNLDEMGNTVSVAVELDEEDLSGF